MSFIPPTPAVKVEIARGKSAVDLGWSQTFYERFCWQYGLQPIRPKESVASLITQGVKEAEPATKQKLTGDPWRAAVSLKWERQERRILTIEFSAGKSGASRKTFAVNRHEAAAMLVLARAADEGWVTANDVIAFSFSYKNGSMRTNISMAYRTLRNKLAGTVIDIQTLPGKGCRIVYAKSKTRAKVRVVKLGELEIE